MPSSFRYFLRILSTICRLACDRLRYSWQAFWFCISARLQGKSIPKATAPFHPQLCRNIFDSFSDTYLISTRQKLNWDASNTVTSKTVVICTRISRLQDDIQVTLNRLNIKGKPKIMLVVIHACGPRVTPENLLIRRPDDRVMSFTNVIYSESTYACYDCLTNREAAADIKRFIK